MSNVISQAEIQKIRENENVILPAGTVITPSARDWANDHNIKISFETQVHSDRDDCLKSTVRAVLKEFMQKGKVPDMDVVMKAVNSCLIRLGYKVEK